MNKLLGLSLLVAAFAAGSVVLAQQEKPAPAGQPAQGGKAIPASASTMEAKWKEYGTPGPEHKVLDARTGKWDVAIKMFEPGSTAAQESKGTCEAKWILGGRFMQETAKGQWMGQPFEGIGTVGYDNLKDKYVSSWVDNMGTGVMVAEGTYDAATKTFTFGGDCPDLIAGKHTPSRTVVKMADADHINTQTFKRGPDGKEAMVCEMNYTRAK